MTTVPKNRRRRTTNLPPIDVPSYFEQHEDNILEYGTYYIYDNAEMTTVDEHGARKETPSLILVSVEEHHRHRFGK